MAEVSVEDTEEVAQEIKKKTHDSVFYQEIFFINNASQSNIYCSTKLRYPSTTQERFLVGTLKGKVSCLERHEVEGAREKFHSSHDMQAREVYFSYIPGDAELISMDAFYKHPTVSETKCLIVGVTLVLLKSNDTDAAPKHFFNIYNALEPGSEFDLDTLAQVCQHQRLGFIPYHLHHADIYTNGTYETVFLLAGSDQQLHIFRCDDQLRFEERSCGKYYPEFTDIPGRVIWMDVKNCNSYKRLAAVGCDNGYLRVTLTDVIKSDVLSTWTLPMDGPISSVRLFSLASEKEAAPSNYSDSTSSPRVLLSNCEDVNLLVTSALEVSVVFLNIASKGLNDMVLLNQSDQFDSVTCSCITDVDSDGNHEIILGTYGQELLIYKWYAPSNGFSHLVHFELVWKREFSKPLLSIHGLDLMGDGIQELVVVSLTGVHILQHEVEQAAEKLLKKIIDAFPAKLSSNSKNNENAELEELISTICSTNNDYNEIV